MPGSFDDSYDFRRFDGRVETQATRWADMDVDRSAWTVTRPATNDKPEWVGNGRNACMVKERGRLALKFIEEPQCLAVEKIAADLGFDLGVPVAPGCLWDRPGRNAERPVYLSLAPFALQDAHTYDSYVSPFRKVNTQDTSHRTNFTRRSSMERQVLTAAADVNTALWVFHVWIGDHREHQKPTNMQMSLAGAGRKPRLAAHDHAYAPLKFERPEPADGRGDDVDQWPFMGRNARYVPDANPHAPADTWRPPIDVKAADAMLARIAGYDPKRLQEVVARVPASLLDADRKQEIAQNLNESRRKTEGWFSRRLDHYEKTGTARMLEKPPARVLRIKLGPQ